MIDEWLPDIQKIEACGGVFVIKFDGERSNRHKTVVVSKPGTDFVFRKDADDLDKLLLEAVESFFEAFPVQPAS